jgi:uncharacterized membrane protein
VIDPGSEHALDDLESFAAPVNRMVIALTALIGVMISLYTLMFKLGKIGTLACGTGACETVQMSPFATQLGIPVPVWGVVGYGVMVVLALLSLQPRLLVNRTLSMLMIAGASFALVFTIYLSYLEANVIHAWCRWCLASAANVVVMFLAALPEIRRIRTVGD